MALKHIDVDQHTVQQLQRRQAVKKKKKKEFNPDFYVFVWEQNISVLSLIVTAPVQYRSEIMVHLHPFQKGVIKLHFLQQNRNLLPTFRRSAAFRSIRPCEVH